MDSFVQQMRNLGPARLAALAGVSIGLLGFLIYFASRLGNPPMERLFAGLTSADAKSITTELSSQKIPFELRSNGTEIVVPANQVLELRIQLADKATVGGGTIGYEIFDQMDSLGATNFMQTMNQIRALEGELARTIMSIEGVKAARVHLVMPKREVFTRDTQEPSAAIFIKMSSGRLSQEQATAVQRLLSASVPKLKPGRVSIVDDRGALLTSGAEDEGIERLNTQEELRRREEARLARSLERLLENVVGIGKIRAEVRADINFDKVVTNQEVYDPEAQVARSIVNRQENSETSENDPGNVSVANNLPNAQTASGGPAASSRESRVEETTNFEISRKITNQIKEGPEIRRLSVAVLVDGTYSTGENGEREYQPRTDEEMDKLASIARSAIGFDAARGDQVEIVSMQFQGLDDMDLKEPWSFAGFSKKEVMQLAESLGVAVVAILVILMVVRPLVARAFEGIAAAPEDQMLGADGMPNPQLAGPAPIPEEEDISDELIDIDKVEGRVKASSLRKIGEIVDKHPDEALSIIRNWLYQEAS